MKAQEAKELTMINIPKIRQRQLDAAIETIKRAAENGYTQVGFEELHEEVCKNLEQLGYSVSQAHTYYVTVCWK